MTQLTIFATLADKITNEEIRDRFTPNGKGSRTSLKTWMTSRKDLSFDSLSAYHRDDQWQLPYAPANRQIEEIKSNHLIWRDRKSTRLNSSHVSSSYAVFCLKKKKTT